MKTNISIELERRHLIAALAEMELDQQMIGDIKRLFNSRNLAQPCTYTVEQACDILREQERRNEQGMPHEEFVREIATWS